MKCAAHKQEEMYGYEEKGAKKYEVIRLFAEICNEVDVEQLAKGDNMLEICLGIVRQLFRTHIAKQLSHMGAVTLKLDQFQLMFGPSHRAMQLVVEKKTVDIPGEGVVTYYRVGTDYGNACYAGWWRNLVSVDTLYELFKCTNEEVLGDGFEMLLGFFEVIGHFQHPGGRLPEVAGRGSGMV